MLAEAAQTASNRTEVLAAIKQASAATGSDFNYLLDTAMRESSLKPQAKSSSSSAVGLFQFVGQTWLGMIKQHGAQYGLGSYADAISESPDGHYHVDNAADHQAILALRND
ncbi:MAG TPA: transglycosylase SLT domain-containing protein, partial [Rhizomicrobium sp.]|nr:transglycosylase SLT domain-containing protein [Rhizomicrobium sp.]